MNTVESTTPIAENRSAIVSFDDTSGKIPVSRSLPASTSINGRNVVEFNTDKGTVFIVEEYTLSTFFGKYGAGQVVDSLSLLPGEKTEIRFRTFKLTSTTSTNSRTIFDSNTNSVQQRFNTALEMNNSVSKEDSTRRGYHADASASASLFGFGSAEASGGISGETFSSRKEMASSVKKTSLEHATAAATERKVTVASQTTTTTTESEEESVVRQIENINRSVTLNFVVLQLLQEFVSLLHLTGIKIGFKPKVLDPNVKTYEVYPLSKLNRVIGLLNDANVQAETRKNIYKMIQWVTDYQGKFVQVIQRAKVTPKLKEGKLESETVIVNDEFTETIGFDEVLRFKEGESEYPYGAQKFSVRGYIVDAFNFTLPTRGVMVESLLGRGLALDPYSAGLQEADLKAKQLENQRTELALSIINSADTAEKKAELFKTLFK